MSLHVPVVLSIADQLEERVPVPAQKPHTHAAVGTRRATRGRYELKEARELHYKVKVLWSEKQRGHYTATSGDLPE